MNIKLLKLRPHFKRESRNLETIWSQSRRDRGGKSVQFRHRYSWCLVWSNSVSWIKHQAFDKGYMCKRSTYCISRYPNVMKILKRTRRQSAKASVDVQGFIEKDWEDGTGRVSFK